MTNTSPNSRPRLIRTVLALLIAVGTVAVALGSTSHSASATSSKTAGIAATTPSLSGICPNPISVALDWTPEAEMGGYFQLAAPNGTINAGQKTYEAPLIDPFTGKTTGVNIDLLSGGPAVGYLFAEEVLYEQPNVLLGVDATDTQISVYSKTPTVAIAAPMNLYPTVLFWNPAKYNFSGIRAIGKTTTTVLYYTGAGYMTYLVSSGILQKSQVQGGFNGSPSTFVASGGADVSQGFAENEPYIYSHELPAWDKSISYQLVADLGYNPYEEIAITRPQNITKYAACFKQLVPMIQEAEIKYVEHPQVVNGLIVKLISQFKVGGPYDLALAKYSVSTQLADKIISQPKSGGFGSLDMNRVASIVKLLEKVHAVSGLPKGFSASSIATDKFIDPNISFTAYKGPYNNVSGVVTVKGKS